MSEKYPHVGMRVSIEEKKKIDKLVDRISKASEKNFGAYTMRVASRAEVLRSGLIGGLTMLANKLDPPKKRKTPKK